MPAHSQPWQNLHASPHFPALVRPWPNYSDSAIKNYPTKQVHVLGPHQGAFYDLHPHQENFSPAPCWYEHSTLAIILSSSIEPSILAFMAGWHIKVKNQESIYTQYENALLLPKPSSPPLHSCWIMHQERRRLWHCIFIVHGLDKIDIIIAHF